jgi:hypothetical protein
VFGTVALIYQNDELISVRQFEPRLDPTRTPHEMAIARARNRGRSEAYETNNAV